MSTITIKATAVGKDVVVTTQQQVLKPKVETSHNVVTPKVLSTGPQGSTDVFSGLSRLTVGNTAPQTPSVGDVWIDTN